MTSPSAETLNLKENWTIVTRRRRSQSKTLTSDSENPRRSQSKTLISDSENPSPWTPTNSFTNADQVSKLLRRMQTSICRLHNSRFVHRFLSRLRDSQIQDGLNNLLLASSSHVDIVAYGIGSIESYEVPRLQLALALLLKQELDVKAPGPIEVFDPILSAVECTVLVELGCRLISVDEHARRQAAGPTIFYMPHCEAVLYDNLLSANWKPAMLRKMSVLGNSFGAYERFVREMRGRCASVSLEADGRHLLAIRKYVREVEMEKAKEEGRIFKEDDQEEEFFKAFHDMSWHFFELDDDAEIIALSK